MTDIEVSLFIEAESSTGTNLWATERVVDLIVGDGEVTDAEKLSLYFRKLGNFCEANFRQYMPDIIKREYGKVYCIHLEHFRLVGFFDESYRDFICLDYFVKKTQKNDKRMNSTYKRIDQIRESKAWTKKQ